MRAACSVVAVSTGVARVMAGDIITGPLAVACGAKELWNLSRSEKEAGLMGTK